MSYLVSSYAPHAPFWESVAMLRKGLLAVMVAALRPVGAAMQTTVAVLVVVANLWAIAYFRPLKTSIENTLEQVSAVVLLFTLAPVLMLPASFESVLAEQEAAFEDLGGQERVRDTLGAFVFWVNVLFFCLVAVCLAMEVLPESVSQMLASWCCSSECVAGCLGARGGVTRKANSKD